MAQEIKEQPQSVDLPWQYILLIIVLVALMPFAASAIGRIERAEQPIVTPEPIVVSDFDFQDVSDLSLNTFYDDPMGISVAHPEGWYVTPQQPGAFQISNYPIETLESAFPPDSVLIAIQTSPIEGTFFAPEDTSVDMMTKYMELMGVAALPDDIEETTLAGLPAASYDLVDGSDVYEMTFVRPDDASFIFVMALTTVENQPYFEGLWEHMKANVTIHSAE